MKYYSIDPAVLSVISSLGISVGGNCRKLRVICGKHKKEILIFVYLNAVTNKKQTPGIIAAIQIFEDRINFHPTCICSSQKVALTKKGRFIK